MLPLNHALKPSPVISRHKMSSYQLHDHHFCSINEQWETEWHAYATSSAILATPHYICLFYTGLFISPSRISNPWYSSQDGLAEGEHVNRGRDTPSFCPTLPVLDMCTLGDATDVKFWQIPRHRPLTYSLSTPCFVTTAPLAVKPASTPRRGEILYLLTCSFLPCLSWLLCSWVRKSWRDLWITLYSDAMNCLNSCGT
jgi:hypothetical protein